MNRLLGIFRVCPLITSVVAVLFFVTPLDADAQTAGKVARIGMLIPVSRAAAAPNIDAFRQGLRERGYVEGESVAIESRFADGRVEPLPGLAAELVRLKVDVIVGGWSGRF